MGQGTAAGRVGEAFYVTIEDLNGLPVTDLADRLDNSGYTGTSAVDCSGLFQNPVEKVFVGDIFIR